jgi:hypothetical protein
MLHSNVEPASLDENSNVGMAVSIVDPSAGPESMVVSGGTWSVTETSTDTVFVWPVESVATAVSSTSLPDSTGITVHEPE